ncbi:MAG: dihydropteroate synthase [Dehalococcoidia bacterium]|nr:dihydropteroate synthase [Dehalococcoidia bacterium]
MTREGAPPPPPPPPAAITIGGQVFEWGQRTHVMGIINASPDSFSGDGMPDPQGAARLAEEMVAAGAHWLDVGAESTRPEFAPVDAEDEWKRLQLVLGPVRRVVRVPISVDTTKAEVARRALEYGADAVNDVSGLRGDPDMAKVVADAGVPVVIMHNQRGRQFSGDVMKDIRAGLREGMTAVMNAGLPESQIIVDPGYGFGWGPVRDFEMLARLAELKALGRPILVGTSRKSSIGYVIDRPARERTYGTAATIAIAIDRGADIVRVHDVEEMAQVAKVTDAIVRGQVP